MEATKSTLHNILNSYYQIPSYQRLYSWEQEHQEELLNNFLLCYKKSYNTDEGYFLGSLIIKTDQHEQNTYDVIDGQQRLTTISLLLKVISDVLLNNGDTFHPGKIIESYIKAQISENKYKNKLKHLKYGNSDGVDSINYTFCIEHNYDEILLKAEEQLKNKKAISKILLCYLYFYNALIGNKIEYKNKKIIISSQIQDDDMGINELSKEDLILLKDFIINKCQLIKITLNYNEDEQEIFNTMNSTGAKLTIGDLVKNYFFSDERLSDLYLDKWQDIFESSDDNISFWSNELDKILFFIQLYQETQHEKFTTYNQQTNYKNLFKLYKNDNKNKDNYIQDILNIALYYHNLYNNNYKKLNPDNTEHLVFFTIVQSGFTSLLSIMFFIKLNNNISNEEKQQLYELTLQLVFIWSILSLESNKLSKFISQLFAHLHKDLTYGINYYKKFIKDNLKRNTFKDIYAIEYNLSQSRHKSKLVFILSFLEMLHIRKGETYFEYINQSIEHIIPKKYKENGYQITEDTYINILGNYTYLSISSNAAAGNKPFVDKKEIYKNIPYVITQRITDYEVFNEFELLDRNKKLYDKLEERLKIKQFFEN
jgi:uncharacterized protein with ParB-like and HNH nuclease domain